MPATAVIASQLQITNIISSVSAANTAAATSAAIDLTGYEGVVALVVGVGAITGSCTPTVVTDVASGGAFATSVVTGLAALTANTPTVITFDTRGQALRYIKFVGTIVTGPTLLSVTLVGYKHMR